MAVEDKFEALVEADAKRLWKMIQRAEAWAEKSCDAGLTERRNKLHKVAGHLRLAYAEGGSLRGDDGEIVVRGGGK